MLFLFTKKRNTKVVIILEIHLLLQIIEKKNMQMSFEYHDILFLYLRLHNNEFLKSFKFSLF